MRIEIAPGMPHVITIQIRDKDSAIYSWTGHKHSVFCINDENDPERGKFQYRSVLYYADFSPDKSGGSIVAVSLVTGTELWRYKLQALPDSHGASPYSNRMNLSADVNGIAVWGDETDGRYFEGIDKRTCKCYLQHLYGRAIK